VQEIKLSNLKGHNPVLDQIARSKSRMTVGAVLKKYAETRAPFLKPGTIEFYTPQMNRLKPLHACNAETLSLSEFDDYIYIWSAKGKDHKQNLHSAFDPH